MILEKSDKSRSHFFLLIFQVICLASYQVSQVISYENIGISDITKLIPEHK